MSWVVVYIAAHDGEVHETARMTARGTAEDLCRALERGLAREAVAVEVPRRGSGGEQGG